VPRNFHQAYSQNYQVKHPTVNMKFSNLIGPCIAVALSLPLASASAVITPRQKSVESWVGPITPSLQACLGMPIHHLNSTTISQFNLLFHKG